MFCGCGCRGLTPIATMTRRRFGHVKGQPIAFIHGHNQRVRMRGRTKAYPKIRVVGHPQANRAGYVREHIVIAERALGKQLPPNAEVHHADGNRANNSRRNLVICENHEYHALLHIRARTLKAGGDPNTQRVCSRCNHPKEFSEFNRSTTNRNGGVSHRCIECNKRYAKSRREDCVAAMSLFESQARRRA